MDTIQVFSKHLTILELNRILKDYNLKTLGNKQEHMNRVIENIDLDDVDIVKYLGTEYKYVKSDKRLNYYVENEYKLIYHKALYNFSFEEYEKYYQTKRHKGVSQTAYEFLDKHEEKAIKKC